MQIFIDIIFTNFVTIFIKLNINQIINVNRIIDFENIKKKAKNLHYILFDKNVNNSISNDQKFKSIVFFNEKNFAFFQNVFVNVS